MKSLVLFGDSLFGRFGKEHIDNLEKAVGDLRIYNCATGGFDTGDALVRADFIAKLNADYVCISLGVNDSNPHRDQPVPLDTFRSNLLSIIKHFKNSQVLLFLCPPVNDPNDVSGTKEFNAILEKYKEVTYDLAHETESTVIDSEETYKDLLRQGENYHLEDGLHLNTLGYSVLIEKLAQTIQ